MEPEADRGLLPTGEFARRTGLSLKALRIYDELGLLKPATVQPGSGRRGYATGQIRPGRPHVPGEAAPDLADHRPHLRLRLRRQVPGLALPHQRQLPLMWQREARDLTPEAQAEMRAVVGEIGRGLTGYVRSARPDLAGGVAAAAGAGLDGGRLEQAQLVVDPQRLEAEPGPAGELPGRQQAPVGFWLHAADPGPCPKGPVKRG